MRKQEDRLRSKACSGQLLIVAALSIAVLISSTTIYVYELGREATHSLSQSMNDFVMALKQGTRNTLISSLANVSNGGNNTFLEANLNTYSQLVRRPNSLGTCNLNFTLSNTTGYDSGTCLSWSTLSIGVSSACADFTMHVYGVSEEITADYSTNITTVIVLNGFYTTLAGGEKLVNLTCHVSNENEPALAKSIDVFYEDAGNWTLADESNNLFIKDYGNGTYLVSFTVNVSSEVVQISTHMHDMRNIFVQANTNATLYGT